MARSPVRVRDAGEDDLQVIAGWWESIRAEGARQGPFAPPADCERFRQRVTALRDDPRHRLLVVESDGDPVGVAVLSREKVSPLTDDESVQISFLHVLGDCRRRGAGRALVAAAAEMADEIGAEFVTVAALPQARESNRFFARLGFSPLVVRRAVSTSALRRRLSRGGAPKRHVVARRRLAGRRISSRAAADSV